jgi:predicted hotdog family 3-hydroxylacyl-ACP dehydratase
MTLQTLNKTDIAARIPHSGPMCLLERVTSWNEEQIHCEAINHRDTNHPLAQNGTLDVMVAIEYAAQAMAVHGALIGEMTTADPTSTQPKVGYLASVREVECNLSELHNLPSPLHIEATRLHSEDTRILYSFKVMAGDTLCAEGRAAVVMAVE